MFEKEAEKAIMGKYHLSVQGYKSLIKNWQDGVEFGYNKGKQEAREVIEGLMRFCRCFAQHHTEDIRYKDAEQFLQEVEGGN